MRIAGVLLQCLLFALNTLYEPLNNTIYALEIEARSIYFVDNRSGLLWAQFYV